MSATISAKPKSASTRHPATDLAKSSLLLLQSSILLARGLFLLLLLPDETRSGDRPHPVPPMVMVVAASIMAQFAAGVSVLKFWFDLPAKN